MSRRQYKNPPIVEAVCEFRFAESKEWDPTIPGRLHGLIKSKYDGAPRQQKVMHAQVQPRVDAAGSALQLTEMATVHLPAADDSRLVSIANGLLGVHVKKPYPGWEDFRDEISSVVDSYVQEFGNQQVIRVGIRYINILEFPTRSIDLNDYLQAPPSLPPELPQSFVSFLSRVQTKYDDAPITLAYVCGNLEPHGEKGRILLDLDLAWESTPLQLNLSDVMANVDDLRNRERTAFEALISEKARSLFDANSPARP